MMEPLLKVEQLTGGYFYNRPVLRDVHLTVHQREVVGLIGLNGAGKSTTIRHILGWMEPFSGKITVNGKTYAESQAKIRQNIGFVPETPILYEHLTLWEHMRMTAMAYEIEEQIFRQRAAALLEQFSMKGKEKWFPIHFSKGMQQKVMLICAFLPRPRLLIVDEPFIGLDPLATRKFLEEIVQSKNEGAGILLSTHVLHTAEKYCDRFVILHEGKVAASGTLRELRTRFGTDEKSGLETLYFTAIEGERQ